MGAAVLPAIIGGGASIIGSSIASDSASDAAAAVAPYKPKNLGNADDLAWQMMQQQAAYQPQWNQYDPASQMMLAQYYNMMGQPYTSPDTVAVNPEYTAWQNAQGNQGNQNMAPNWLTNSGQLQDKLQRRQDVTAQYYDPNNPLHRSFLNPNGSSKLGSSKTGNNGNNGNGQGTAPPPTIATPGQTYNPQETSYMDYLNQYLSGAFDQGDGSLYDNYLNRAVQGTRSGLTARGLNTSPYGAGIEGETSGEFARQWMLDAQNRQGAALQNYMAGQSGMQGLGQSALASALQLEQLKKGWNQSDINNMMQYMGLGGGNSAAQAAYINQAGQAQAQPWAQLANTASTIDFSNLFNNSASNSIGLTVDNSPFWSSPGY